MATPLRFPGSRRPPACKHEGRNKKSIFLAAASHLGDSSRVHLFRLIRRNLHPPPTSPSLHLSRLDCGQTKWPVCGQIASTPLLITITERGPCTPGAASITTSSPAPPNPTIHTPSPVTSPWVCVCVFGRGGAGGQGTAGDNGCII